MWNKPGITPGFVLSQINRLDTVMALPIAPVLKLIALGSLKIIFLGLGALIVPIFTVRLVVGGTGESVRMATYWMIEHGQLEEEEAEAFFKTLGKVQQAEFTRSQARGLLFAKIKKTATGTLNGFKTMGHWISSFFKKGNT